MSEEVKSSEPAASSEQQRGELVTQIQDKIALLNVLIKSKQIPYVKCIFQKLEQLYNKFIKVVEFCKLNEDFIIHDLFVKASKDVEVLLQGDVCRDTGTDGLRTVVVARPTGARPGRFAGDTREFFVWYLSVQVFLKQVESAEERLLILYQATAGKAREVIEPFLFEPPSQATLDSALDALRDTYGSESQVTEAYFLSLEEFPPIEEQDVRTLRSYVNLLKKGMSMTKLYPSVKGFDSRCYLRQLIAKLPGELKISCVKRILREDPLKPFGLDGLVSLLEDRLKVLSHPWCAVRSPN